MSIIHGYFVLFFKSLILFSLTIAEKSMTHHRFS